MEATTPTETPPTLPTLEQTGNTGNTKRKTKKSTQLSLCRQALQITRDIKSTNTYTELPNSQGMTAGRYAMIKVFGSRNKSLQFVTG